MSIYIYEVPITVAICFADFCVDQSPTSAYAAHLADATRARANPRGALEESKRTDRDDKDHLRLIKVLYEYLPQPYGGMGCVAAGERSPSNRNQCSPGARPSVYLFNASPRLALPSPHYDLAASLLTYAYALSNLASALIATYDHDAVGAGVAGPGRCEERLGFAVNLLCQAAGVLGTLAEGVLPAWERGGGGVGRSVDLSREVVDPPSPPLNPSPPASSSPRSPQTPSSPRPPLPKSQPSPALLAKLHLECAAPYGDAGALVGIVEGAGSTTLALAPRFSKGGGGGGGGVRGGGEITPALKRHLSAHTALHTALAHKWLGVDVGEGERAEEAVGFLARARKGFEELRGGGIGALGGGGSGGGGDGKGMERGRGKGVVQEPERVSVVLAHYTKINDSVRLCIRFVSCPQPSPPFKFQNPPTNPPPAAIIPAQRDMQARTNSPPPLSLLIAHLTRSSFPPIPRARIPAGRLAVAPKPYAPPWPAFGRGSLGWEVRSQGYGGAAGDGTRGTGQVDDLGWCEGGSI
ncbi:hypothetical protein BV22DRAFT_1133338 [Leucogyrophana mollusca]|uniref:Uncharacterized protein n=1 Tax=Leucogyrophana mollusca TaxID=85980 RepID=A0ACB8B5V5_9AGAM|nr:hypothetical protein BV22DRAFT_1133338 [Leucogyrophana mollusca]